MEVQYIEFEGLRVYAPTSLIEDYKDKEYRKIKMESSKKSLKENKVRVTPVKRTVLSDKKDMLEFSWGNLPGFYDSKNQSVFSDCILHSKNKDNSISFQLVRLLVHFEETLEFNLPSTSLDPEQDLNKLNIYSGTEFYMTLTRYKGVYASHWVFEDEAGTCCIGDFGTDVYGLSIAEMVASVIDRLITLSRAGDYAAARFLGIEYYELDSVVPAYNDDYDEDW